MADNVNVSSSATYDVATRSVTYSGDTARNVQVVGLVGLSGSDDAKTATDLPGDANGLEVQGSIPHDTGAAGNPVRVGMKAIAHGTNPTAVTAADVTDWYANRAGVPFVIGGHPNIVSYTHSAITTAVTDTALVTIATGLKIVVTRLTVTLDNASTVFPTVKIGFGTSTIAALGNNGIIYSHGGFPAGGGQTIGDGSGMIAVGADNEDLRITTTGNATGNGLQVSVSYYTIES